mgnify:CR=1 FL=1
MRFFVCRWIPKNSYLPANKANIPAEMIDKIQVIDEKSDMAKLTGFDDDEGERIINLSLKKDRKKGLFGNYSGALGADMVYALPTAEISVMDPAAAVAFLWNDRITPEVTRASLEEEWVEKHASPEAAACDGSIDDVIDPAELRQRICSAVYMLLVKNGATPLRKHCNLPL